jgi:amino acid transporter
MIDKWEKRFRRSRMAGVLMLIGLPFLLGAYFASDFLLTFCIVAAMIFFVPAAIYLYVLVVLHWKDRYRGKHTDLWGAIILIETSGWFKIVYFFRHMLPDMNRAGRYRIDPQPALPTQAVSEQE